MNERKKRWAAAAAAAVAAATVWTYLAIDAEDWTVTSPRLPAAFDGMRITLLTDLHGVEFGGDNRRLLQAVAASEPDLIAVAGDLLHENTDPAMLEPLLQGLTALAPTCFVTGNHEWGRPDAEAVLTQIADAGVTVLRDDYLVLEREGQQLALAGVEDIFAKHRQQTPEGLLQQLRQAVPGDPYVVMLCHRNNTLNQWAALEVDLVLAGHGHGGVIRLPLVGGLLSVERTFFPKDAEGLYTRGRTVLAVSRGIGGVRLWNRPHLPTIVLKHGE